MFSALWKPMLWSHVEMVYKKFHEWIGFSVMIIKIFWISEPSSHKNRVGEGGCSFINLKIYGSTESVKSTSSVEFPQSRLINFDKHSWVRWFGDKLPYQFPEYWSAWNIYYDPTIFYDEHSKVESEMCISKITGQCQIEF